MYSVFARPARGVKLFFGVPVLLVGLLFGGASEVSAQAPPSDGTFYGKLGGGLADFVGDVPAWRPTDPFVNRDYVQGAGLPIVLVGEFGYQFSSRWGLAVGIQAGNYPIRVYPEIEGVSDTYRYTPQVLGRYTFGGGTVAPYIDLGAHVTVGGDRPPTRIGVGPSVGGGVNFRLSDAASFYVESRTNLTFPDGAVDGSPAEGRFDLTNQLFGFGLKVNFSTPTPPKIRRLRGPSRAETGAPVTFTAQVNEEKAEHPLTFEWDLGDGATQAGQSVTHTYDRPGTVTVALTVKNEAGSARQSMPVTVSRPPLPARIVSASAAPNPVAAGRLVQFRSAAEGPGTLRYTWSLGDGTTVNEASPEHKYETPGRYTAQLRVANPVGVDTQTVTVRVVRPAQENTQPAQTDTSATEQAETDSVRTGSPPARDDDEGWGIVVASMAEEDRAAAAAERYRGRLADRLSVKVVSAEDRQRHRVVVGPFRGAEAAEQALSEYSDRLPPGAWLLRLD